MPRIRCHYADCVFLDEGYCAAAATEIDPEEGCLTYSPSGDAAAEETWEDGEDLDEDWEEAGFNPAGGEDEEDDDWDVDDFDEEEEE